MSRFDRWVARRNGHPRTPRSRKINDQLIKPGHSEHAPRNAGAKIAAKQPGARRKAS